MPNRDLQYIISRVDFSSGYIDVSIYAHDYLSENAQPPDFDIVKTWFNNWDL